MFTGIVPQFVAILLFAGLALAVLPSETIRRMIGEETGLTGMLLASLVGAVTLVPVMIAFPIVAELLKNGGIYFVIYKGAFLMETETVAVAFNPTIVMRPELVSRNTPLTAETYRNDIKDVKEILEDAVADGFLTEMQKKRVLDKMEENLARLE